jgi:hypothetical protein
VRIGAIFAFTGALLIAVGIVVGNEMKQFGEQADMHGQLRSFSGTFLGLGVLFLVLGLGFLGITFRLAYRRKRITASGEWITAEFVCVEPLLNVTFNGRPVYRAKLCGRDPFGEMRDYYSGSFQEDLTAQLSGRQIPVCIDRDDPARYYVDLDKVLTEN